MQPTEIKLKTQAQLEKESAKAKKVAKFLEKQKKIDEQKAKQIETSSKKKEKKQEIINYKVLTKIGDKKDTCCELPSAYYPKYVEASWYEWWDKEGFFRPEHGGINLKEKKPEDIFTIVIPPPNVTGTLHIGHALAASIEDTISRWHRMKGKCVLFNPGCDHAGIATQVVVEKKLQRERRLTRHDLGRDSFIKEVWKWKNEKGHRIYDQLKKLGAGVDWDRAVFMMDPKIVRAVTEAFIRMHEKGVIYRSTRLVNWCCTLRSAISDIEVDKVELSGRTLMSVPGYEDKIEFGVLISFAYPIENSQEEIVVATTRLETMLGDVAVAVHPDDERYTHLIGKRCKHPFLERHLPIIADSFVEKEFGTGAVKITPAHDHNDYKVGEQHQLPFINIFSDDGLLLNNCGAFSGMKRFDARAKVLEELKKLGLHRESKEHQYFLPICSRSKDLIEPIIKAQWYVKCGEMATRALDAVNTGALKIIPDFHLTTWNHWLSEIRDWCISRQLWWGHQVPAYFISINDSNIPQGNDHDGNYWVSATNEADALKKAAKKFNVSEEKISLRRDEDVLDTWFSAGMWPFSIMGWPENTSDMRHFFPGALLETGHDILFFWVARMVFMAQELCGQLPFKEVFLHAIVRDAHGRKMTKSLGNVIDPLDVIDGISLQELHKKLKEGNLDEREILTAIEGQKRDYPEGIPECGTDALRFALLDYSSHGRDINLDVLRVRGDRFFCNKIWQACRFVLAQIQKTTNLQLSCSYQPSDVETIVDKWILSRMANCVQKCDDGFHNYNFNHVTSALRSFWWEDFCDVYIETVKSTLYSEDRLSIQSVCQILYHCMDTFLRLLAPVMPFITEELWQRLPKRSSEKAESICVAKYPSPAEYPFREQNIEENINSAMSIVKSIRSIRKNKGVQEKAKTDLLIEYSKSNGGGFCDTRRKLIETLASAKSLKFMEVINHSTRGDYPDLERVEISSTCIVYIDCRT